MVPITGDVNDPNSLLFCDRDEFAVKPNDGCHVQAAQMGPEFFVGIHLRAPATKQSRSVDFVMNELVYSSGTVCCLVCASAALKTIIGSSMEFLLFEQCAKSDCLIQTI